MNTIIILPSFISAVMATQARRGTFAFDLSKPQKKGILLKQGQRHKAFKHRLFVLYPGFLVYYEDETKWRFDLTKGETLGVSLSLSRLKLCAVLEHACK